MVVELVFNIVAIVVRVEVASVVERDTVCTEVSVISLVRVVST